MTQFNIPILKVHLNMLSNRIVGMLEESKQIEKAISSDLDSIKTVLSEFAIFVSNTIFISDLPDLKDTTFKTVDMDVVVENNDIVIKLKVLRHTVLESSITFKLDELTHFLKHTTVVEENCHIDIPEVWKGQYTLPTIEEFSNYQICILNKQVERLITTYHKDNVKVLDSDDATYITVSVKPTVKVTKMLKIYISGAHEHGFIVTQKPIGDIDVK